MWQDINKPTKIFSGTAATINVPVGSVLLHLRAIGAGTIAGIPDGQGGSLTLTTTAAGWLEYDPCHLNVKFQAPAGATLGATWSVVFSGTSSFILEVMNPNGGF